MALFCFFVINPRVLSANGVDFGPFCILFHKFSNFIPPPPAEPFGIELVSDEVAAELYPDIPKARNKRSQNADQETLDVIDSLYLSVLHSVMISLPPEPAVITEGLLRPWMANQWFILVFFLLGLEISYIYWGNLKIKCFFMEP